MPFYIDGQATVAGATGRPPPQPQTSQQEYETRTGDAGGVVPAQSPPIATPVAPIATTPPAVTGGGGGGGTGGYVAPAPVTAPAPVAGPAEGIGNDALATFTEQDIVAALASIEAEFGLTQAELLADQTMIGAQYRLLAAQLATQRQRALEGAEAGALQRGLFRSGIYAKEVGDVAGEYAARQAEYQTQADAQQAAIDARLAALDAEKEAAKAAEEQAIRNNEYAAHLQAAGL